MQVLRPVLMTMILFFSVCSFAATEYLRFEGTIADYPALPPGLEAGQFVYFDFQIDTEIDPDVIGDDVWFEEFQAIYTGGNYVVEALYGFLGFDASNNIYQAIYFSGVLAIEERINCDFDMPPPRCQDTFVLDWEVGSTASLLLSGFEEISLLEVTHRDFEPPPPIPLPGALGLFVSAVVGGLGLIRGKPGLV